jgi:hypothetical protein
MGEHTKGPWEVDCNQWGTMPWSGLIVRTRNDGDNGESDHDGLMIVGVGDCGWNNLKYSMPILGPQLSEADARLIAAAPDLLAVCQELAESAAYWSEYDVPLGIVDRLKAAIAKATGATT